MHCLNQRKSGQKNEEALPKTNKINQKTERRHRDDTGNKKVFGDFSKQVFHKNISQC